jgi:hypothetical protein
MAAYGAPFIGALPWTSARGCSGFGCCQLPMSHTGSGCPWQHPVLGIDLGKMHERVLLRRVALVTRVDPLQAAGNLGDDCRHQIHHLLLGTLAAAWRCTCTRFVGSGAWRVTWKKSRGRRSSWSVADWSFLRTAHLLIAVLLLQVYITLVKNRSRRQTTTP